MKKKKAIKSLRSKAWGLQSEFVRKIADGKCFTCGDRRNWKEQQAGHFIHGDSLDFDIRNIHCQCVRCNHYLSGNLIEYTKKMLVLYGDEVIEELQRKKHASPMPTCQQREFLEGIIKDYKRKLELLDQIKNNA